MKRVNLAVVLVFLLMSCGTKKRTTYSKKKSSETVKSNKTNKEYTGFPFPEDAKKFTYFSTSSIEEYLDTYSEIAQFEMKAYGIPASITLAQGILESGYGMGNLTRKTNNHFGIKCHTGWEGEFEYHDDDEKGECFRKYNHPMYSFRDHSIFLSSRARYASLFDLRRDDYKGWAKGLKQAGYATDKAYPQKLISFIERYQLYKYDQQVLGQGYMVKAEPKTYDYKMHVVKKGDTLYSISRTYYITVDEIMELNGMNSSNLSIGQELKVKSERVK